MRCPDKLWAETDNQLKSLNLFKIKETHDLFFFNLIDFVDKCIFMPFFKKSKYSKVNFLSYRSPPLRGSVVFWPWERKVWLKHCSFLFWHRVTEWRCDLIPSCCTGKVDQIAGVGTCRNTECMTERLTERSDKKQEPVNLCTAQKILGTNIRTAMKTFGCVWKWE